MKFFKIRKSPKITITLLKCVSQLLEIPCNTLKSLWNQLKLFSNTHNVQIKSPELRSQKVKPKTHTRFFVEYHLHLLDPLSYPKLPLNFLNSSLNLLKLFWKHHHPPPSPSTIYVDINHQILSKGIAVRTTSFGGHILPQQPHNIIATWRSGPHLLRGGLGQS